MAPSERGKRAEYGGRTSAAAQSPSTAPSTDQHGRLRRHQPLTTMIRPSFSVAMAPPYFVEGTEGRVRHELPDGSNAASAASSMGVRGGLAAAGDENLSVGKWRPSAASPWASARMRSSDWSTGRRPACHLTPLNRDIRQRPTRLSANWMADASALPLGRKRPPSSSRLPDRGFRPTITPIRWRSVRGHPPAQRSR